MIVCRAAGLLLAVCALLLGGLARAAPVAPDPAHTVLVMLRTPPDHFRADTGYAAGYDDAAGRAARSRIARRIARLHRLTVIENWPMPTLGVDCIVMAIGDARAPEAVAAEVAGERDVSWAQPLNLFHAQAGPPPSDPLLPAQPAERLWHLTALHRIATGRGVSVAVIDSRIDRMHPDLAGQVIAAQDFTTGRGAAAERHGTEVAGIIAAKAGNGLGISGVAPGARLLALRACWEGAGASAVCDSLSLAKALQYAVERSASVINLSLSGPRDPLLARLIAIGLMRGATIVAAIDPAQKDGGFPASEPGVLGASDRPMVRAAASVYVAPGRDIPTTAPGGKWLLVDGSSFAAAHLSGLSALAREQRPRAPVTIVRDIAGVIDPCRSIGCRLAVAEGDCGGPCTMVASRR
jgi:subtilisin family serine protease